jgi:Arc/MetJ-type ribon-helix-helix transcriptional regulator
MVEWIDRMVEKRVFANKSHGIEVALIKLKEEIEGYN